MNETSSSDAEKEIDYYKFYKEMYEERYHTWRFIAVSLIATISSVISFLVTYFLLTK